MRRPTPELPYGLRRSATDVRVLPARYDGQPPARAAAPHRPRNARAGAITACCTLLPPRQGRGWRRTDNVTDSAPSQPFPAICTPVRCQS